MSMSSIERRTAAGGTTSVREVGMPRGPFLPGPLMPVALLGAGPVVLVVNSKLPVNSVKELLALAREKPGQLHYVSGGIGSFQHLTGALFKLQSGADIVHVPFKGAAPAMMDVVAGNTEAAGNPHEQPR